MEISKEFQTPPEVCDYMVQMIPPESVTTMEPTPGLGNLINAMFRAGHSPCVPAGDYFLMEKARWDCIVMNPPFSTKSAYLENAPEDVTGMKLGYWILRECMEMSDHVIALMPWFTIIDSDLRLRELKQYGMKSITALPRKTFGYARIQTMILELSKGYTEETIFKTFDY